MRPLHTLLFLLAFTICLGSAADTYRWVDDNGVVHYSDSPNPNSTNPEADRIEISQPNVMRSRAPVVAPAPASASRSDASEDTAPESEGFTASYQDVRVVSPSEGETLWNIGGTLTVNLQATPSLAADHGYVVYLDGELIQTTPAPSSTIVINDVYRGEHTLRAAVRTNTGAELIVSDIVTFYVRQATAN